MARPKSQTEKTTMTLLVPAEIKRALGEYCIKQKKATFKTDVMVQILHDFLTEKGFELPPIENKNEK